MSVYSTVRHFLNDAAEKAMKEAELTSKIDDTTRKYALKRRGVGVSHLANAKRAVQETKAVVAFLTPQKANLGLRFHQSKRVGGSTGTGTLRPPPGAASEHLRSAAYKVSAAAATAAPANDLRGLVGSLNAAAKRAPGTAVRRVLAESISMLVVDSEGSLVWD